MTMPQPSSPDLEENIDTSPIWDRPSSRPLARRLTPLAVASAKPTAPPPLETYDVDFEDETTVGPLSFVPLTPMPPQGSVLEDVFVDPTKKSKPTEG